MRSAQLLSEAQVTGVKVTSCAGQKPSIVVCQPDHLHYVLFTNPELQTLTPAKPGRFLFQMDSEKGLGKFNKISSRWFTRLIVLTARDGLKLQITYRMLREGTIILKRSLKHCANIHRTEVETLIELAVSEVSAKTPSLDTFRQDMIDKLVQALEADASWVELYGVTGELVVPGITQTEGEMGSGLREVMEVGHFFMRSLEA